MQDEKAHEQPHKKSGAGFFRKVSLAAFVLAVLLLHVVFTETYPLQVSGDGGAYLEMMAHRDSDLIHASGYPFLIGLPLQIAGWNYQPLDQTLESGTPYRADPGYSNLSFMLFNTDRIMTSSEGIAIKRIQHTLAFLTTILAAALVYHYFGLLACVAILFAYGMDVYMIDDASTARPEWFQAFLLVLSLFMVHLGHRGKTNRTRIAGYLLAAFIFAWCYLTKPIALGLCGFVFLPPLLDKGVRPYRLRLTAAMVTVSIVTVYLYLSLYHRPSTGTMAYSYTIGWVASYSSESFSPDKRLTPETGINTARLLALYQGIQAKEGNRKIKTHMFRKHVHAVDPNIRRPYREAAAAIWKMPYDALVGQVNQGTIPDDPQTAWGYLYYYWGLKETNDLGIEIYKETARQYPYLYAKFVGMGLPANLLRDETLPQCHLLTTWRHPETLAAFHMNIADIEYENMGNGFIQADFGKNSEIGYGLNRFWLPGMQGISQWVALRPPSWVKTFLFFGTAFWAVVALITKKGRRDRMAIVLFVAINLVLYLVLAQAVAEARWHKEIRTIQPVLTGVACIGLAWLIAGCFPALRGIAAKGRKLGSTGDIGTPQT